LFVADAEISELLNCTYKGGLDRVAKDRLSFLLRSDRIRGPYDALLVVDEDRAMEDAMNEAAVVEAEEAVDDIAFLEALIDMDSVPLLEEENGETLLARYDMIDPDANDGFEDSAASEFAATVVQNERIENNVDGGARNIQDVYSDLVQDVNELSKIAMYPRFGSHGIFGEVHCNRLYLQVVYSGPNADDNNLDVNVQNDSYHTLKVDIHRDYRNKCIHGGQIYNPGNVNSNFSKVSEKMKDKLSYFVIWLSDYLSSNRPGRRLDKMEQARKMLKSVLEAIEKLCRAWKDHEQYRDNAILRTEMTMGFKETSNYSRFDKIKLFWPNAIGEEGARDFNSCVFLVPQSEVFDSVDTFFEENVKPLLRLLDVSPEKMLTLSASTKTRMLWCAESLVRETANTFFVGKIHNALKGTNQRHGKFHVPTELKRFNVSVEEKHLLGIQWGIVPGVFPSWFRRSTASNNAIENAAIIREAIGKYKGKVDCPRYYVEAMNQMWVTAQRFSMNKNKYHDIGYFEEPDWDVLATMNARKCNKFVLTLMRIVLRTYRKNWLFILKQQSRCWEQQEHIQRLTECPITCSDIETLYPGSMLITDNFVQDQRILDLLSRDPVTNSEKEPIRTVGTFFLFPAVTFTMLYIFDNVTFNFCSLSRRSPYHDNVWTRT
jgi:hypothetical protein